MKAGHYYNQETGLSTVLIYSEYPDVPVGVHREDLGIVNHVAQASYRIRQPKGISVYLMKTGDVKKLHGIDFARSYPHIPYKERALGDALEKFSIVIEAKRETPFAVLQDVVRDIENFSRETGKEPRLRTENRITYTADFTEWQEVQVCGTAKVDHSGKQAYVPSCILDLSIDFFRWSCASLMRGKYYSPFSRCDYCYAKGWFNGAPIKRVLSVESDELVEQIKRISMERAELTQDLREQGRSISLRTRVLRLGELSEAGSLYTLETSLLPTLEACVKAGIKPVFPTKMLAYDPRVVELLKKSKAAVLYSIGADQWEEGPFNQGCGVDFRIEQALKHQEAGVKTGLYLLIDGTNFDNPLFKANLDRARALSQERKIPLQVLPIRPVGLDQLLYFTNQGGGLGREFTLTAPGEGKIPPGYVRMGNNQYAADRIDPRFLELEESRVLSMCHHDKRYTHCGGCLQARTRILNTDDPNLITKKGKLKRDRRKRGPKPTLDNLLL